MDCYSIGSRLTDRSISEDKVRLPSYRMYNEIRLQAYRYKTDRLRAKTKKNGMAREGGGGLGRASDVDLAALAGRGRDAARLDEDGRGRGRGRGRRAGPLGP